MLTPMDIHNREFKKGLRGYKESEVDEFLDRIVIDYEKLMRENEKLKEQLRISDKELTHYRNLEKNLQDTLVVAQKTADEVVSAAKKNAREMRENSVRESKIMYDNTVRETQNMREQAQIDIKRQLDAAQHKLHVIAAEYSRVITDKEAYFLRIRTALESELAVINQLLHTAPRPEDFGRIQSPMFDAFTQNAKSDEIVNSAYVSTDETDTKVDDTTPENLDAESDVELVESNAVDENVAADEPAEIESDVKISSPVKGSAAQLSKIEQALKSAKAVRRAEIQAELEKTAAYNPVKKS